MRRLSCRGGRLLGERGSAGRVGGVVCCMTGDAGAGVDGTDTGGAGAIGGATGGAGIGTKVISEEVVDGWVGNGGRLLTPYEIISDGGKVTSLESKN